jgi:hypothetical protein
MQRTAYRCTMCGREFENKDTLEQHEKESHPQSRVGGVGNAGQSGYEGAPFKEGTRPDLVPKAEFYCSVYRENAG